MTDGLALKELAHALAAVMHADQSRKGTGEPYIRHVERVANAVQGWQAKTVAYLHDLVEDTGIDLGIIDLIFGSDITEAVRLLTRHVQGPETYAEFVQRVATSGNDLALAVKEADIRDNLRDINDVPGGGASLERRYTSALSVVLSARAGGRE